MLTKGYAKRVEGIWGGRSTSLVPFLILVSCVVYGACEACLGQCSYLLYFGRLSSTGVGHCVPQYPASVSQLEVTCGYSFYGGVSAYS